MFMPHPLVCAYVHEFALVIYTHLHVYYELWSFYGSHKHDRECALVRMRNGAICSCAMMTEAQRAQAKKGEA